MPRSSKSLDLLSDAALGSLNNLGQRLKEARLRRNWTQLVAATKAGLSESSIKKVEAGSPRISISAYIALLDIYGLPTALDQVMAPGDDVIGDALSRSGLRKRAREAHSQSQQDEWEI